MKNTYIDVPLARREDVVQVYGSKLADGTRTPAPAVYFAGSYAGSMGIASSATDLAKMGRELLRMVNGRGTLIRDVSVIQFLLSIRSPVTDWLGWARGPLWQYLPGETGGTIWFGGSGTGPSERGHLLVAPEKDLGLTLLLGTKDANRDAYAKVIAAELMGSFDSRPTRIAQQLIADARAVLRTTSVPMFPNVPHHHSPSDLSKFVGTYFADLAGNMVVSLNGGNLVLAGQKLILEDLRSGRFRFPDIAGPGGIDHSREPVVFKLDADGKPTEFRIAQVKIFRKISN